MKALIEINYVSLGGFRLETNLTESEIHELKKSKQVSRRLLGQDETLCVMPLKAIFVDREGDKVFLKGTHFAGSNKLPDPSLFERHMKDYKANGWRLVKGSEEGFFDLSYHFRQAIQPTLREKISDLWRKKHERFRVLHLKKAQT